MVVLELAKGGQAELVKLEDDRGTVKSPMASAPGSRLAMIVNGRTLRLKVHRCVRDGDHFTIAGRFIDLTRDLRDTLLARLTPEDDPSANGS